MIRQATKYDKKTIIDLMTKFREESPVKEIQCDDNEQYWNKLLDEILAGRGACFLYENCGLLLCMVIPNIWNDKILVLHELAWYVKPEFRKTTIGYRLFKKYIEFGNKLKSEGRIKYFTISKMISSPDLNYGKYGFNKIDENWIQ